MPACSRRVRTTRGAVKLTALTEVLFRQPFGVRCLGTAFKAAASRRTPKSRPLDRDPVRVKLPIEIRALDAEGVGGAGDVAGEIAQARQDELLLEGVTGLLQRQVRRDF